ncbi:GNAT family N-acetyltransferase [Propylenella binzhouense]|uniref:N-acetyltransferase n=1 Tax=Propylenella binzhouense TaxID=2555902 RepID=A0A964T1J1_9HYPH|nr:GNAT family N-acetyltransferase [Propylenella binzhouense]MYZ46666.1 N-acetyltransferase [Propylenella binzhouense]
MTGCGGADAGVTIRVAGALKDVARAAWDACANPPASSTAAAPADPDRQRFNPFLTWDFLQALEEAGCVSPRTGWTPRHLVLEGEAGGIAAVMPCYVKTHSQGEYVFDYGWADAFERAGGRYYPKLQVSVPFTPVPGRRFLVRSGEDEAARQAQLAAAMAELVRRNDLSSAHLTFLTEAEWKLAGSLGFLQRIDQQFHWSDEGYGDFEGFLAALASRKRKALRKERREALCDGITVEWVTGSAITEAHWDAFFAFYMDTGSRKWGRPYLNRRFFSLVGERMADRILLVLARRNGRYVAGALNFIGSDTLYGRYWGCTEEHPFLHFELCYYQAIDYALAHGLQRVEAGAQGAHKLARGYLPATTYSAHYIAHAGLRRAVANYLESERQEVAVHGEILAEHAPFRRGERLDAGEPT